jgi:hypothetical protein
MGQRFTYGSIKSLLHFNYPYWSTTTLYEPNYGLRDELNLTTWTRYTTTPGTGYDKTNKKFGWASTQFINTSEFIMGTMFDDIYNMNPNAKYEIEFFMRITTNQEQNIFKLAKSSVNRFVLKQLPDSRLNLSSSTWDFSLDGADLITTNIWNHILIRVNEGVVSFFINGILQGSVNVTTTNNLFVDELYLGEFIGNIDEYCFRHEVRNGDLVVPTVEYSGNVLSSELYGYGSATLGNYTTSATTTIINSYATVTNFSLGGSRIQINRDTQRNGVFGDFVIGDEIIIHVLRPLNTIYEDIFKYCIRKVVSIEGNEIIVDREIDAVYDFPPTSTTLLNYVIQIIKVPCFQNLTINNSQGIIPLSYNVTNENGGIIALKCSGTLSLGTSSYIGGTTSGGLSRTDDKTFSHSDLINRGIINYSANWIFIMANIVSSTSTSYIGLTKASTVGTSGYAYNESTTAWSGVFSPGQNITNRNATRGSGNMIILISNNLTAMKSNTICCGGGVNTNYMTTGFSFVVGSIIPNDLKNPIAHSTNGLSVIESIMVKGSAIQRPELAFDFTDKTYIDSFYLMGYQPQNTMRKVIFEVDGVWNRFNETGFLDPVATQTPTTDTILEEGNTIDEIALLKDIVPFRGKRVRVAVAMSLQDDTVPTPTLRIGVLAR